MLLNDTLDDILKTLKASAQDSVNLSVHLLKRHVLCS